MYVYRLLLPSLFLLGVMSELAKNSDITASINMDLECAGYCYGLVKPVLQYAASMKYKEDQLKSLENQLDLCNGQRKYCLTKEELLASNQANMNEINENRLNMELKKKDFELLNLKSQEMANAAKIKDLEKRLSEREIEVKQSLPSSCIGKLTETIEIKVPGSNPFEVACDSSLVGSGWTVIQRRQDGSENFNRSMNDYRSGFGNLNGEFFIGLDKLHLLTKSQGHELYIYLQAFNNNVGYARYNHFFIGGETENYKLKSLGSYSGNATDALNFHLNMQFSTSDEDNDNSNKHCAEEFSSGWWFHSCYHCNLNGIYRTINDASDNGVNWNSWNSDSLQFVQMMIRPR